MTAHLASIIDAAWENRMAVTTRTRGEVRQAAEAAMAALDSGALRVAERIDGEWRVHQWLKKAVLLFIRLSENGLIEGGPGGSRWWDKVPSKFDGWGEDEFRAGGFRAVPNCVVRRGVHIGRDAIVLPSFINFGAHIGEGTMVDSWVTVGSCAQIGRHVHLSAGVSIGGVVEPLQANPVIIEDHCFIGARSDITEGVIVGEGAVIASGTSLSASTKIVDRDTGEVFKGRVPPRCVVVPGALPGRNLPDGSPGPSLACAVIVKRVDAATQAKTAINDLVRDSSNVA
ncbi:2,3,4,5-tetrahydropyridine-2,6-dicarboxylate N-succinyltransferase [Salinarimonas soli]|uniref:2,3,4,5-tetrahydropyridine-2,6-dicarboxylate N-succinyltransferase n=1 Tax=Salinarimonas soli TaxID=1638099 RepID=A0A5B2VE16_9HYPH|nr:2,3,4,5-tetrahydropyridine-2,6-dicarboxylate N-succinyltransferase [Salinarimonas soli]KAA2236609.1 2,3,4,5-tetrahydropyridine-2,6-dicarboxylate N-succinyltransferase [Salinarimonas soli]